MRRRRPVLVIGDANADLVLADLEAVPRAGREVLAGSCELTLGGSSTLFAAALARLGWPVEFRGKVGRDPLGDLVLDKLSRRGVNVSRVRRDQATGITVSISRPPDRALVTCAGSIATTRSADIPMADLRRFRHLHVSGCFLLRGLRPDLPAILDRARRAGLTTSLDPGWDPRGRWNLRCRTDILFVNRLEEPKLRGVRADTIVIKKGARGAEARRAGVVVRHPGYLVRARDATGAGDCFDAGFLYGTLSGWDLGEALSFANACGAASTRALGGYEAQPTLREARRLRRP
jgi:sugar/nucleoside kinase (ribokinase family)